MKKIVKQEVTTIKEVVTAVICDGCGKEHKNIHSPSDWHSFEGHYAVRYDDGERFEYHVCSASCYLEVLDKYCMEYGDEEFSEIDSFDADFAEKLLEFYHEKDKGEDEEAPVRFSEQHVKHMMQKAYIQGGTDRVFNGKDYWGIYEGGFDRINQIFNDLKNER